MWIGLINMLSGQNDHDMILREQEKIMICWLE
jgi:hypothetical protein